MAASSNWYLYTKRADFSGIAERFGIDPVTVRVLRNRDVAGEEDIRYLLQAGITDLYDESGIPDLEKAAELICKAIDEGEHIRIVGDYDIDGVCATCILLRSLSGLGAKADHRIPERIRDGYGINANIVREAIRDGVDLILTCDNGIAAVEELALAKEAGIKVVVTDHHNVKVNEDGLDLLPPADAVVNVKRKDSRYPTSEICGAVTAWKLVRRIFALKHLPETAWLEYLDLAAVATVGDVMELSGENRIIVREGLKLLSGGRRPWKKNESGEEAASGSSNAGLKALLSCLELEGKPISTYHVGFMIGPCINAGGRLETAETALRLFMTDSTEDARKMALHLRELNEERKSMTEKGVREGMEQVEQKLLADKILVVYLPELHESLAGIVAGRLKEAYGKPAFVLTPGKDGLKGSGRSIEAYNMFEALCGAEDLLIRFGGHPMAAGISLQEENLEAFRKRLNETSVLQEEDFIRKIWIDAAMPLSYIHEKLVRELEALAPFGPGFERPLFAQKGLRIRALQVMGRNRNVLKLQLFENSGTVMEGILFGEADRIAGEMRGADTVDIVYIPKINEYQGSRSIQLEIRDYRCH